MNQMPPVTKNLLIINVLCFAAYVVGLKYNMDLNDILGLHFFMASDFKIYQIFTYMFMHGSWQHIFFNMFAVWMFGRIIEGVMGSQRFLLYYIACGLGAGMAQECVQYIHFAMLEHTDTAMHMGQLVTGQFVIDNNMAIDINMWTTVGASGAVYGILLAFGMFFPNERMFIFPLPVPIKAKFFVCGYALIELFLAQSHDGVAHYAHLGGMLIGLIILMMWRNNKGGGGRRMSDRWKNVFKRHDHNDNMHIYRRNIDMEYHSQEKKESINIDKILDKVKTHGYEQLTEEEKKKLFDYGQKH